MSRHVWILAAVAVLALVIPSDSRTQPNPRPNLDAIADTRLLMEGLARANYRGLQRNLRERPDSVEGWAFVRGQALLIAETGNLLMLRPPRNAGQGEWMVQSMELRIAGTRLALAASRQNYEGCRNALAGMAAVCNRCHRTFQVAERVGPLE